MDAVPNGERGKETTIDTTMTIATGLVGMQGTISVEKYIPATTIPWVTMMDVGQKGIEESEKTKHFTIITVGIEMDGTMDTGSVEEDTKFYA